MHVAGRQCQMHEHVASEPLPEAQVHQSRTLRRKKLLQLLLVKANLVAVFEAQVNRVEARAEIEVPQLLEASQ